MLCVCVCVCVCPVLRNACRAPTSTATVGCPLCNTPLACACAGPAAEQLLLTPGCDPASRVAAACLYRDETGWLTGAVNAGVSQRDGGGEAGGDAAGAPAGAAAVQQQQYLWVSRKGGSLECWSLPHMAMVFQAGSVAAGEELLRFSPTMLLGLMMGEDGDAKDGGGGAQQAGEEPGVRVVSELRVESFKVCARACVWTGGGTAGSARGLRG